MASAENVRLRSCGLKPLIEHFLLFSLFILSSTVYIVSGRCPNLCSGHGDCTQDSRCVCWRADKIHDTYWTGADCSLRECPRGSAWSDKASGNEVAHQMAECSNRGHCNRATGNCICQKGQDMVIFDGAACERLTCPNDCNGHGACTNLLHIAKTHGGVYDYAGHIRYQYDNWDASKIWSCECDRGYEGYDCSLRKCPKGDDPLTPGNPEVQSVSCIGVHKIQLGFNDEYTQWLKAGSTTDEIRDALQSLESIDDVEVSFQNTGANSCSSSSPPQVMMITFHRPGGDVGPLTMNGQGNTISIFENVKGTTENLDCAGRGICDQESGLCVCNFMFASSDGHGNSGTKGDCGFLDDSPFPVGHMLNDISLQRSIKLRLKSCPSQIDGVDCTDHGTCSGAPAYQCSCMAGWTGSDCSQRTCPKGNAWSDVPTANNFAHKFSECSNMGICDREKGLCKCRDGFSGAACDKLNCPSAMATICAGHGSCMSMRQLARKSTNNGDPSPFVYGGDPNNGNTWDADHVFGCECDEGYTGYACTEKQCPTGDDPKTKGINEIQVFRCTGGSAAQSSGDTSSNLAEMAQSQMAPTALVPMLTRVPPVGTAYFTLTFRGETTPAIFPGDDVFAVQRKLEYISSIGAVIVTFKGSKSVCSTAGVIVTIEFLTETGGSANLDMSTRKLAPSPPPLTLGHAESGMSIIFAEDFEGKSIDGVNNVNSTTENSVCADRGLCDPLLGSCLCFPSFTSSTKRGNKGACDRIGKHLWIDPNSV
jgi:hypothetical protein